MMKYLIIILCGFLSCLKVTMQGRLARKSIKNTNDSIMSNCLIFAFTAMVFSVSLLDGTNGNILVYAFFFGVSSAAFQIFYALSLRSGPFSISCLLVNLNMILPAVFSIIYYNEKLTLIKFIGLIFCISALILNTKSDGKKTTLKWFLYVTLAFLSAGLLAIVQKMYAKSVYSEQLGVFLFWGYFIAFLITFVFSAVLKFKKQEINFKINKGNLIPVVIIVLSLCIFQYLLTMANSFIDSVVLNPSVSGLSTMFLTVSGFVVFREHLTLRQILSIFTGFVGIVLISI